MSECGMVDYKVCAELAWEKLKKVEADHAAALAERDKEIERLKQECAEVKEDRNKWRIVAEAREARLARLEEAGRMGLDALYAGCATASDGPCAWECENSTADDVNDCARYGCGAAVDALRAALEGEVKP